MVNYILKVLTDGKSTADEVDLTSLLIEKGYTSSQFSLQGIDAITTSYQSIDELIQILQQKKMITRTKKVQKLFISYKYNKKEKSTGIIYKEDVKFLNPQFLIHYISMHDDNIPFLKALCSLYKNDPVQSQNIEIINSYICNKEINMPITDDYQEYIYLVLKDFVSKQIYAYDYYNGCYQENMDSESIINYKKLHDLAYFATRCSKKFDSAKKRREIEECYLPKKGSLRFKKS